MTALALAVLSASLLGSLHCAGMCGGFVAVYAGGLERGGARVRLGAHLAYSAGRLAAYASLGAAAGALGAALDATGRLAGVQRAAAVVAGALIVLWGALALAESRGVRLPRLVAAPALRGLVRRGVEAVAARPPAARGLAMGLLTGLLPCGWLYAFVITAAGTGSALAGAATMAVFWLGTLPAMIGVGIGLAVVSAPLRRYVPTACALAMIALGLLSVAGRARPLDVRAATGAPAPSHHHAPR